MARVTRVAVAAPNVAAAEAGARVGADGGGAVDAAIAAALVTMITEPGIVSLAGGAFVTVWPGGSPAAVTVDGCVAMPGLDGPASETRDEREVRTGYGGGVTMTVGLGSVAVPGALTALDLAQSRYGTLPWSAVVEPAVHAARDGFVLGTAAGYYLPLVRDDAFGWDPETRRALQHGDGRWLAAGDRMVIDGLEGTVRLLADEGARTLRDGTLAEAVAADMSARGGLVTRTDLASYRPVVRDALPVRAGRWDLRTNPPPAIGGPVLAAMLSLLGDRPQGPWTEDDVAHLVAVQRRVLDVRRDRLDVTDDRTAAALRLLDEVGWEPSAAASPSTAHVSAVDADGTACAITTSYGYGSGATVPGTGLWLNNCLGERELNRSPRVAPGGRLASNMAPTVGRRDDGAVLALGSPGADRITTALLQVLASVAYGGAGLQEAVDRPRLHVHHLEDGEPDAAGGRATVQVEAESDLPLPALDLLVRRHNPQSMYFGGVGAALLLPDGRLEAAADPRRVGAVVVSPVES
jgi:gamma-glutamyltranspeptidase/glutathione hydrolase